MKSKTFKLTGAIIFFVLLLLSISVALSLQDLTQCSPNCCIDNDGDCPNGCNSNNDNDCQSQCGNLIIEPGEECDGNCPESCYDHCSTCFDATLLGSGCNRRCEITYVGQGNPACDSVCDTISCSYDGNGQGCDASLGSWCDESSCSCSTDVPPACKLDDNPTYECDSNNYDLCGLGTVCNPQSCMCEDENICNTALGDECDNIGGNGQECEPGNVCNYQSCICEPDNVCNEYDQLLGGCASNNDCSESLPYCNPDSCACEPAPQICGDGLIDVGEECDIGVFDAVLGTCDVCDMSAPDACTCMNYECAEPVDMVFLVDPSPSMVEEAGYLCEAIGTVTNVAAEASGDLATHVVILGPLNDPYVWENSGGDGSATCIGGPGNPFPDADYDIVYETLRGCPGFDQNAILEVTSSSCESWGQALIDAAEYDAFWRNGSQKIVVLLTDEDASNGNDPDACAFDSRCDGPDQSCYNADNLCHIDPNVDSWCEACCAGKVESCQYGTSTLRLEEGYRGGNSIAVTHYSESSGTPDYALYGYKDWELIQSALPIVREQNIHVFTAFDELGSIQVKNGVEVLASGDMGTCADQCVKFHYTEVASDTLGRVMEIDNTDDLTSQIFSGLEAVCNPTNGVCASGTRLCGDGRCCSDCSVCGGEVDCKDPGVCEAGDSCYCQECDGQQDACQDGGFCVYIDPTPEDSVCVGQCESGTALCQDYTCSENCTETDTGVMGCKDGVTNGICEPGEGCACPDCNGEQDSCGWGAFCVYDETEEDNSICVGQCPSNTSLCLDYTCSNNCTETDTGNMGCKDGVTNGICEPGEGCGCSDCDGRQDSCARGNICNDDELCEPVECPDGTALCNDGTCSEDCPGTDNGWAECLNDNGQCDFGEGCGCYDCLGYQDSCADNLVCDVDSRLCTPGDDPTNGGGGGHRDVMPCDEDDDGFESKLCGGNDCNDKDKKSYPGAVEICDGKDNDCDKMIDDGCVDLPSLRIDHDGDGWYGPRDCDDNDSTIYPGAEEVCNGLDDDCDREIDEGLDCEESFKDMTLDVEELTEPEILEVFELDVGVENTGETTLKDLTISLELPKGKGWKYSGVAHVEDLTPDAKDSHTFKVLIGPHDDTSATIRVDLKADGKRAISKNIPITVKIPTFAVKPEPTLNYYSDKLRAGFYKLSFYYIVNNKDKKTDLKNLDLEFGVNSKGILLDSTVAADLVSSGLFEGSFTIPAGEILVQEMPSNPYLVKSGKVYVVEGRLREEGNTKYTSEVELDLSG